MNESKRFTNLFNDNYYANDLTDIFLTPEKDSFMTNENTITFFVNLKPKNTKFFSDEGMVIGLRGSQYDEKKLYAAVILIAKLTYGDAFDANSIHGNNTGHVIWFTLKGDN